MPLPEPPDPALVVEVATVALLRRFPLRSAGGEQLRRVWVGADGLDGDRRFTLAAVDGTVLTARDLPALRGVGARLEDGALVLQPPLEAVAHAAGEPLVVREAATGVDAARRHSGGAAVHLVSDGAARAGDAPVGCDPGERANVVLVLDPGAASPGAERGWVGRRLRLGEVQLALTRTPSRCLGVYAEVVTPGWLQVGDAVLLTGAPAADR